MAGAGGFIGSWICGSLSRAGHEIVGHVRSEKGDITPNSIPVESEVVVNAAGRLGGHGGDTDSLTASNEALPKLLGDFCRSGERNLIHISTPGVTGLRADAKETDEYDPWGDYERTKMRGEKALLEGCGLSAEQLTILRPDFVYGPGDMHKYPLFFRAAGGWFPLIGSGSARLRPTYAADVCSAVEASLPEGPLSGGIYNIGGPEVVSFRELVRTISEVMEVRTRLVPVPRMLFRIALKLGPLRPSSLSESRFRLFGEDHFVSITKAVEAGFSPRWSLRGGIGKTVEWYREEGVL